MATVTDDRAQLLLAGAFVLAVALLGLTIVLSAGNYTASLAGDSGSVSQGDDALTARASVAAGVRSHLRIVNARSSGYSDKEDAIESATGRVADRTSDLYARQGRVVTTGTPSFVTGVRIKQVKPTSGPDKTFKEPGERAIGASPAPTWQLTDGETVRNMTFHFSQLPSLSEDPFELRFRQSSGPEWNVEVNRDVGTTWTVVVEREDGSFTDSCTRPLSTTDETVDVSNARMDGTYCSALDAITLDSNDYQIFVHTPNPTSSTRTFARGQFWLIAIDGEASLSVTNPGDTVKRDTGLVYSATVPFAYRSPAVEYEAELEVAPGEIE